MVTLIIFGAGGVCGWLANTFFGDPIERGLYLKETTDAKIRYYDNVGPVRQHVSADASEATPNAAGLREAQTVLRELAT